MKVARAYFEPMPPRTPPELAAFQKELETLRAELQRIKETHPANLYDVLQAAAFLKVTKHTIYQYIHRGTLKPQTPPGYSVLFTRAELERYAKAKPIRAQKKKAQPPRRAL